MRQKGLSIDSVRDKMKELVGKPVLMSVCRGRKQVKKYTGVLENTFPSVFVVKLSNIDSALPSSLSYSYCDIMCGEVVVDEAN
jgi:uncharacterized protein Veg